MRMTQHATNSLILDPDSDGRRPSRAERRTKRKKINSYDRIHKARNGKVYAKGRDGGEDKVIKDSRYDGRFA